MLFCATHHVKLDTLKRDVARQISQKVKIKMKRGIKGVRINSSGHCPLLKVGGIVFQDPSRIFIYFYFRYHFHHLTQFGRGQHVFGPLTLFCEY